MSNHHLSRILGLTLLAAPLATAARADPAAMLGTWIDHTGRGAVEFSRCGGNVCGRLVWMKEPNDEKGKPFTDGNNPDPARRARTVCGLQIIGDAAPQADGSLDKGWIYNPEDGKSYSVELRLISPNVLRVHGYAGLKFLGESFVWKRAPQNTGRCAA
jgi:uncharacterized protein (DUF2147 family)